jgi:hypothetical protein
LSRRQLPQYIDAAPAVTERIRMLRSKACHESRKPNSGFVRS